MAAYVIAVRRGLRDQVGRDWSEPLTKIDGLQIVGDANPYRLRIEATNAAIELVRKRLAPYCRIEGVQRRYILDRGSGYDG